MISKESLIIIAIVLILAIAFMAWSQASSDMIMAEMDKYLEEILQP